MHKLTDRKSCILLIGFLILTLESFGQYTGFKAVENITAFKTQFTAEAKKTESIRSNFVQEKNLSVLSEKIVSEGKFWFKRANKVRIEYQKPFSYLLIMNGDQMLVKDNDKENKINVNSNKLFQQVNRIMVDCVQGTILTNKDFKVLVFESDKTYLLEMTPVSKGLKDFFQKILVYVDKSSYSVASIDMREPSGDNTLIRFVQKELNATWSDEIFSIH